MAHTSVMPGRGAAERAERADLSARPFDRILVPARPAGEVERAVSVAVVLARRTAVPVRLLSVQWTPCGDPRQRPVADGGAPGAPVPDGAPAIEVAHRVVGIGSVAAAIVEDAVPGTLICMASHGARGPARTLTHTVADEVVRAAREPVLLVGPRVATASPLGAGHVVACVGDARRDEVTVDAAAHWSRAFGLPLGVVHVTPAPGPDVDRRLDGLARGVGGVDARRVIQGRHPARALAGLAATGGVALLVMAPAGRAGWDRVLAGSVTASTVRRAAAPVLAVPPRPQG